MAEPSQVEASYSSSRCERLQDICDQKERTRYSSSTLGARDEEEEEEEELGCQSTILGFIWFDLGAIKRDIHWAAKALQVSSWFAHLEESLS